MSAIRNTRVDKRDRMSGRIDIRLITAGFLGGLGNLRSGRMPTIVTLFCNSSVAQSPQSLLRDREEGAYEVVCW